MKWGRRAPAWDCGRPWLGGPPLGFVTLCAFFFGRARAAFKECHPKCAECHLFDFDQSWHCIKCKEGYSLWVDGCFPPCPEGFYRNGYDCEACTKNCLECTGPLAHECVRCKPGYKFDFRQLCIRECTPEEYPDYEEDMCLNCDPYCQECISKYKISCTRCYVGYKLRIVDRKTLSGECMQDCTRGYFRDTSDDLRCIQCFDHCAECDSLHHCFTCDEGYVLHQPTPAIAYCYPIPTASEEQIDFDSYLKSGAGVSWNWEEEPPWDGGIPR